MSDTVIKVENLSKQYRLGLVSHKSIKDDLFKFWNKLKGNENPFLNIGDINDRTQITDSNYVWSLKDINFEIKEGEVLGVLGKNGAGKSTLLKILSKITAPATGNIKVKGKIASLLEVGTGFHPELTGRENIFLNGSILGMRKEEIKRKFDEIVAFSEVEKYLDTPVKRYSSGMYVRLAFAVAAHLEPEILIVDEVLSVGDAEFQKKCIGKMKDVSSEGRTIIFVSHNIPSIQHLCTHGIVLKNGLVSSPKDKIENSIQNYLSETLGAKNLDLAERNDRKGNGKIKFIDYKFLDADDNYISRFISGQKAKIRLFFQKHTLEFINELSIAISITSSTGVLMTVFCNEYLGKKINVFEDKGYFDCIINKVPFMEDTYSLNIMMNTNSEIFDWIENAFVLDIENGDYFLTGKIIENTHKSIMIDHDWSYKKN